MLRVIIGTVAVLAGFAVVEQSVDASTGVGGSCKVGQAYALLQPGRPLEVRATPGPDGTVIGTIASADMSREVSTSGVSLIGSQAGWARIALGGAGYTAVDAAQGGYGWVPADALAVSSRLDGSVTMFTKPGLLGQEIGKIKDEDLQFRVLGCRGDWLQVINAEKGNVWIDRWCAKEEGCRS
ncbi:MAG TPA: hypothetical protein VEC60_02480 [Reyranella sp.]|nr:hypothetical protein [Reyranella sp.]